MRTLWERLALVIAADMVFAAAFGTAGVFFLMFCVFAGVWAGMGDWK